MPLASIYRSIYITLILRNRQRPIYIILHTASAGIYPHHPLPPTFTVIFPHNPLPASAVIFLHHHLPPTSTGIYLHCPLPLESTVAYLLYNIRCFLHLQEPIYIILCLLYLQNLQPPHTSTSSAPCIYLSTPSSIPFIYHSTLSFWFLPLCIIHLASIPLASKALHHPPFILSSCIHQFA